MEQWKIYGDEPVTLSVSATTTSSPSSVDQAFPSVGTADARYLNEVIPTTSDTTKLPL